MAASPHELDWLSLNRMHVLQAISCGAVFMGALTYIGNGPNFMVKAIAEEAAYRTPSFFGYMVYSGLVLGPVLLVTALVFF
jgi:Na+/H+ antiporter NhaD/arsenite permease-like protein